MIPLSLLLDDTIHMPIDRNFAELYDASHEHPSKENPYGPETQEYSFRMDHENLALRAIYARN